MFRMDTKVATSLLGALTDRRLAALRLVMTVVATLILYVITNEPRRYPNLTYYSLLVYVGYSVALYIASRRRINFSEKVAHRLVWADLAWYTVLTALSNGSDSLFFFFFLFAIIVASSKGGTPFGLLVTGVSAALCILVSRLVPSAGEFDVARFAMRPLAIVGLGYILAYWGGAEIALKRKMALLNELSLFANPRFGVDWTIELILRRLLGFWNASHCVILLTRDAAIDLYIVSAKDPNRFQKLPVQSPSDFPYIDMSDSAALVYNDRHVSWRRRKSFQSYDPRSGVVAPRPLSAALEMSDFLGARSFLSVPLVYRERFRGRIVVSSTESRAFGLSDAAFLQQLANQVLPVIENIRLVERLAADASEEERNRIARSVHDRVIQPYYGLQIGLKALQGALNKEQNGNAATTPQEKKPVALLSELISMTADGIDELRQYISGLKQSRSGDTRLSDSIRRFASKFDQVTGIHVTVTDNTGNFVGNERLTSEMFQMAAEALSNVHRHTDARSAAVTLNLGRGSIQLEVENERQGKPGPAPFMPESISGRAETLGGRTDVIFEEGRTVLRVEVPL
jgi:signal transduction histidine kinase